MLFLIFIFLLTRQKREAQQKAEIIAFSQQNYTDQNRIDQDKATAELAKQNQIVHIFKFEKW